MSAAPGEITLIIPVYNAEHTLCYVFESLQAQTVYPQRIIFVDNVSTDASWEKLEIFQKEFKGCEVSVLRETRKGPSAARNLGIRAATTPLLGFFDSDMSLHADWTRQAVAFFQRHPEVDAVAGCTEGHPQSDEFQKFQSFYRKSFDAGVIRQWPEVFQKGFLTFANAVCRADFFSKSGMLPEEYFVGEDLYLNIKALQNGAVIMLSEPTLISYHFEKYGLYTFLRSRFRYRTALARVMRALLAGNLVFRDWRSRPCPITAWVGNPEWLVGAILLLPLLICNPLWIASLPLWAFGMNVFQVTVRSRGKFPGVLRVLYYAYLQTIVFFVLLWAQVLSLWQYRVLTL